MIIIKNFTIDNYFVLKKMNYNWILRIKIYLNFSYFDVKEILHNIESYM